MRPVALRTRRLVLDQPMPYDAEAVTRHCQDPVFEQYLTTPWPYTRADADAFLGVHVPESWATGAELTWALRLAAGGELLGVISVRSPRHEVGYWIGAAHRGAGYMSEAAIAVVDWALGGGLRGATSLHWRAVAELPASYFATVQLVPADSATGDPSGPPLAQHDGVPAGGTRPTSGWAPGEVITDPHVLTLPEDLPPGDYLLIAALYDPEHPEQPRPAVTQGGQVRDFVRLEQVRVGQP